MCFLMDKKQGYFALMMTIFSIFGALGLVYHYEVERLPLIVVIFSYIAASFWGLVFTLMFLAILFIIVWMICTGCYWGIAESATSSNELSQGDIIEVPDDAIDLRV